MSLYSQRLSSISAAGNNTWFVWRYLGVCSYVNEDFRKRRWTAAALRISFMAMLKNVELRWRRVTIWWCIKCIITGFMSSKNSPCYEWWRDSKHKTHTLKCKQVQMRDNLCYLSEEAPAALQMWVMSLTFQPPPTDSGPMTCDRLRSGVHRQLLMLFVCCLRSESDLLPLCSWIFCHKHQIRVSVCSSLSELCFRDDCANQRRHKDRG